MKLGMKVTDSDTGYKELATRFKTSSQTGHMVFVGVLRSSGKYKPKDGTKAGKGGITVAQIAAIHEFGAKDGLHPPQRSFMGSAIDENAGRIEKLIRKLSDSVILGFKTDVAALGILGQFVKDLMRDKIVRGIKPELKPSTIERKGAGKTTPLIDTGQLLGSINFEVRRNK